MRLASGGRRDAYEELIRRHAAKITAVCRSRLGPRGPVEDMVQESFLRGYRVLGTLLDPEKFGSWLYGIASRACLDWLKAKERTQLSLEAVGEAPVGRDLEPARDERHGRLLEEIDALPDLYREVVFLFYYQKQSYQEMSRTLGLSPAAVNARLTKARAKLRERLAGAVEP